MIGIDSNWSKLLKTIGLLAVRLDLAKLRMKNHKKKSIFDQNRNHTKKTEHLWSSNTNANVKGAIPCEVFF